MTYPSVKPTTAIIAITLIIAGTAAFYWLSPSGEQHRRMSACRGRITEVLPDLHRDPRFATIELAASTDETIWVLGDTATLFTERRIIRCGPARMVPRSPSTDPMDLARREPL